MVVSVERSNGTAPTDESVELQQEEQQEGRVYWKDIAGSVRVKNIPLVNLDLLKDGHVYTSVVTTKKDRSGNEITKGGNETVIDTDFAYLQVGLPLNQLGFSTKDIGSKRLNDFIAECLKYYPEVYNQEKAEKESERLNLDRVKVYAQSINTFKKLDMLSKRTDRLSWTDEQWIDWMSANGFIQ